MKKSKKQSADDTAKLALKALEGKLDKSLPADWQRFAGFWKEHVEKDLQEQRATAAELTKSALKIENAAKKKQAESEFAALITRPVPADAAAIVDKALQRLKSGKKDGKLLTFPSSRMKIFAGGGILAAAAVALVIVLMRPQPQYAPASPERMQAILQLLPEREEEMGLLEERDSEEVMAFTYGFYTELAKSFPIETQSKELAQVLGKYASALQRRGFTQEAREVEALFLAAGKRALGGAQLLATLNRIRSGLKKKWSAESDFWNNRGEAIVKMLAGGYGKENWDDFEDLGLEKVRVQVDSEKPRSEKVRRIDLALQDIFTRRKCSIANKYCNEQKEKIQDILKDAGIYRF